MIIRYFLCVWFHFHSGQKCFPVFCLMHRVCVYVTWTTIITFIPSDVDRVVVVVLWGKSNDLKIFKLLKHQFLSMLWGELFDDLYLYIDDCLLLFWWCFFLPSEIKILKFYRISFFCIGNQIWFLIFFSWKNNKMTMSNYDV